MPDNITDFDAVKYLGVMHFDVSSAQIFTPYPKKMTVYFSTGQTAE